MLKQLLLQTKNYNFYYSRNKAYERDVNLPFRVSPTPYYLNQKEVAAITEIGKLVASYFRSCSILINENIELSELLNKGKPEVFIHKKISPDYPLIRPDLLYTDHGFVICEIETSIFGLALATLLNEGYSNESFQTLVSPTRIKTYFNSLLPNLGEIIYSDKTKSYRDQLAYLADTVFSSNNKKWVSKNISESENNTSIYRAFYLHEYMGNPKIQTMLDSCAKIQDKSKRIFPALTPQLEEKALLALIWDKRYIKFFENSLGKECVNKLQKIIPKTLIIGQEKYFIGNLPVKDPIDLASLPRSQRQYALKVSGFDPASSWAEGVVFLHEVSSEKARELLNQAISSQKCLYILQEFLKPKKVSMEYEDGDSISTIQAGLRITPYYDPNTGELITIKATGCEHTNYIHASSASINTAVAVTRHS